MFKVTVLYGTPTDPAAFDEYYRSTHIPLASKMQGLTEWNLTWVGNQDGSMTDKIYLIADLYAADEAAMMTILGSPEGQAASADVPNFATGGATFLFGGVETVIAR